MGRIGCFAAMGLWPNGVLPGDRPARLRGLAPAGDGSPPAALSQDRCIALAGLGTVRSPRCGCLRSGTSPWPAGNRFRASRRCARRRIAPVRALRGCRPAGGRRRPRYAFVSHALAASSRAGAAYGCPGSGVGAPLLWCELGPVGPTCRSRWSGLGSGWIIGQGGGVWQRLRGGAGGNCANAGRARPRYVGRCGAPSHSGGARHAVESASVEPVDGTVVHLSVRSGRPRCGQAERARRQRS